MAAEPRPDVLLRLSSRRMPIPNRGVFWVPGRNLFSPILLELTLDRSVLSISDWLDSRYPIWWTTKIQRSAKSADGADERNARV